MKVAADAAAIMKRRITESVFWRVHTRQAPNVRAVRQFFKFQTARLLADSMCAATKKWDFGASRLQLSNDVTAPVVTSRCQIVARRDEFDVSDLDAIRGKADSWRTSPKRR
jgi:hypothetical protein